MSFFIYIIYSESRDKYYVGYTQDIEIRVEKHNAGATPSTRPGSPWIFVYSEEYNEKSVAIKREIEIKKMKSRKYIEKLIGNIQNS
ncbi:MAG: GIY-YIG nuclease family protein [Bacteroidota bacterium]|nr:GIY-YIG nuclease family protein [Bacteroidota bacterium]